MTEAVADDLYCEGDNLFLASTGMAIKRLVMDPVRLRIPVPSDELDVVEEGAVVFFVVGLSALSSSLSSSSSSRRYDVVFILITLVKYSSAGGKRDSEPELGVAPPEIPNEPVVEAGDILGTDPEATEF